MCSPRFDQFKSHFPPTSGTNTDWYLYDPLFVLSCSLDAINGLFKITRNEHIHIVCWLDRPKYLFLSSPVGNVISLMSTDIPRDFQRHYVLDHFTVLEPSRHQAFSLCISISSRRLFASSFIGFSIIALPSGRGVRGACMLEA